MGLVRTVGLEEDGPAGTDLTRAGTVLGTPDYMAPEQAKNSSLADHRADLYSVGGTFYYVLTGKPPFPAGTPIEKILKHQHDPPPPLQAIRPDVPDDLARLVARLLAKDPADRPASADEVAAALEPLARFTDDTVTVRVATPDGERGAEGVDTGNVASSHTVPPSTPGTGVPLPRRLAAESAPPPADPPTPPTPLVVELPAAEDAEAPGGAWKLWAVAVTSAAAGVAIGVLAWAVLGR
jgi:serine/threonine-protein kinase